jgi:hypothetical protein
MFVENRRFISVLRQEARPQRPELRPDGAPDMWQVPRSLKK